MFLLSSYTVQDSARKIARVAIEAKLDLDEEEYVESFRPHLMDVVHAWCSVSQLIQYIIYLYTYPFIHLSIMIIFIHLFIYIVYTQSIYPSVIYLSLCREHHFLRFAK